MHTFHSNIWQANYNRFSFNQGILYCKFQLLAFFTEVFTASASGNRISSNNGKAPPKYQFPGNSPKV